MAFSPDGKCVAAGFDRRVVKVWDIASGQQILNIPDRRDAQHSMKFSPDGRLLAVGGNDWCVRVLDATLRPDALSDKMSENGAWRAKPSFEGSLRLLVSHADGRR